jgi:hypothetical protein
MTAPYYTLITDAGLNNHANAAANMQNLNLAKMVVGDSGGTYYDPDGGETALVNQKYEVDLTHVMVDPNNKHQLIVEAVLDESVGPFYIREVGILDDNLDENGKGTLFAIGKYPETFKPDLPDGSGKRLYIRMIIGFASTPSVEVIINNDISLDPNFGIDVNNKLDYLESKSGKNVLINGDFDIWQRGILFADVADSNYTADRWIYYKKGEMSHAITRSNDVPTVAQAGRLFSHSVLIDCTVDDTVIGENNYALFGQKIEGHNFVPIAQKTITVSFWVKATKTGIYCVSLRNHGLDRSCIEQITIDATDNWEFKSITFDPSPSDGTWNYSNGKGLDLLITLATGSLHQTTTNSWQTGNFHGTVHQVNACDSTSNNFRLAGVQMEEGSIATNFDSRTIQEELALCQRYYEKSYSLEVSPGAITSFGSERGRINSLALSTKVRFSVSKRAIPSVINYNPVNGSTTEGRNYSSGSNIALGAFNMGTTGYQIERGAQSDGQLIGWHWTADADL